MKAVLGGVDPDHLEPIVLELERRNRVVVCPRQGAATHEDRGDLRVEEVTLPGVYEDVRVDDLKHDFAEARID